MTAANRRWRRLAQQAVELLLILGVTLGFFSGFLALLGVVFPSGVSLRTLLSAGTSRLDVVEPVEAPTPAGSTIPSISDDPVAMLTVLRADVKRRLAGGIAWDPATTGLGLRDRDGVQTGEHGRARLDFEKIMTLELERNSLLIVNAPASGVEDAGSAVRGLVLVEGDLWARLRGSPSAPVTVSLPNAVASLTGTEVGRDTEVRLAVRRDRTTTVAVAEGAVSLTSKGTTVRVGPSQYSRIDADGVVSLPRALPPAPDLEGPPDGATFPYLDLPPRVTFRWRGLQGPSSHLLRVARDPEFGHLVVDETTEGSALTWGRLEPGVYFWKVARWDGDVEGLSTPSRKLIVSEQGGPVRLVVESPPQSVNGLRCFIRGRVDRGATVYVLGQRVTPRDGGRFEVEVKLDPGANVVLVEAVDAAGQSTYWSQVVNAKP